MEFLSFVDTHNGTVTAIATIVIAIFTIALAWVSRRQARLIDDQVKLSRHEFLATHRPKIGVRAFNIAFEGVGADHMHACSFIVFNEGESTAYVREVNCVLINGEDCWNQMGRKVQFRNPDKTGYTLKSGQEDICYTQKEFNWDRINSNWFLVGYISYSDEIDGGIERKTGFCRRWIRTREEDVGGMRWVKQDNEEYEYRY